MQDREIKVSYKAIETNKGGNKKIEKFFKG
jgi:hypothetical protein